MQIISPKTQIFNQLKCVKNNNNTNTNSNKYRPNSVVKDIFRQLNLYLEV